MRWTKGSPQLTLNLPCLFLLFWCLVCLLFLFLFIMLLFAFVVWVVFVVLVSACEQEHCFPFTSSLVLV